MVICFLLFATLACCKTIALQGSFAFRFCHVFIGVFYVIVIRVVDIGTRNHGFALSAGALGWNCFYGTFPARFDAADTLVSHCLLGAILFKVRSCRGLRSKALGGVGGI